MAAHQVLETDSAVGNDMEGDFCVLERGEDITPNCMNMTSNFFTVSNITTTRNAPSSRSIPVSPTSNFSSDDDEDDQDVRIVLVGKDCYSNQKLLASAQALTNTTVVTSENGLDCIHSASESETLFVLSEFEGETYDKLHKAEARIIGPPVVYSCERDQEALPYRNRPLFCLSMRNIVVCFTGFKGRDNIGDFVELVHHMGGSIRRKMTPMVTHLIASRTGGEKYNYAMNMGMPIMGVKFVEHLWRERCNIDITASSDVLMQYKIKPFFDRCISFLGFSAEEEKHMQEVTVQNGGTYVPIGSEKATHLVIDEMAVKELPTNITPPDLVVRAEWFWACIQIDACAEENLYIFHQAETEPLKSVSTSNLRAKSRKRKRLRELAAEGEQESPCNFKRRSEELSGLSLSPNSFLDASRTPDKHDTSQGSLKNAENKLLSKRQLVVMELLQTETNYNAILRTLLHTIKSEVEHSSMYVEALLPPQDVKTIFGNIPPIYKIHQEIKDDLTQLVDSWNKNSSVGDIILKQADALMKAYPNYVNYVEMTKETIKKCDESNQRFHAFLMLCKNKQEFGRQSLTDMLIRPVQRLPSIILLLKDILKYTPDNHVDKERLQKAVESLSHVLMYINDQKKENDGQLAVFGAYNMIDSFPLTLVSSHRSLVTRIDVVELCDTFSRRGERLSLFLFTDCIEVCKRRTSSGKSLTPHKQAQKPYKHLEHLPLSGVKRILDFTESEDCLNAFGIIYRGLDQASEKLLSFMLEIVDVEKRDAEKREVVTTLCRTVANAGCRTDFDSVLAQVSAQEFVINTKDLSFRSFKSKISKRVSRAFSVNRTPSKLKRTVSSVLSPFKRDTPLGNLTSSRLAASNFDLTEYSPSTMSHFDDSDCISLGTNSFQEEGSSLHLDATTPTSAKTPKFKGFKWPTIGPHSGSRHVK